MDNALSLSDNEIDLWFAYDEQIREPALLNTYHGFLNEAEGKQQQRFYFDKHRHQYLITRALVRSVLSLYHPDIPPKAWLFNKNQHGKPFIANELANPVHFNISHTEKLVVIAITADRDVGVDVEWMLRRNETLSIAQHYFSPAEIQQLFALPEEQQQSRFFDLWTLKEAYIKACGKGLAIPLDHFSYLFNARNEVQIRFAPQREDTASHWRFWQIAPNSEHKVALAIKDPSSSRHYRISLREIIPQQQINVVKYPLISHPFITEE